MCPNFFARLQLEAQKVFRSAELLTRTEVKWSLLVQLQR